MHTALKRSVLVLLATTLTTAFAIFPMSSSGETSTQRFQITTPATTATTAPTTTTVDPSVAVEAKKAAEVALWMKVHKANEAEKARVAKWIAVTNWNKWMKEAARVEAARKAAAAHPSGRCGGDLPPCSVMNRESKGDIRIWNGQCYNGPCRGGSTASGKWQFLRSTWNRFMGYLNAADAPEWVQDAKARQLWAGGRGRSHWGM